jgi:hypothetical protein
MQPRDRRPATIPHSERTPCIFQYVEKVQEFPTTAVLGYSICRILNPKVHIGPTEFHRSCRTPGVRGGIPIVFEVPW